MQVSFKKNSVIIVQNLDFIFNKFETIIFDLVNRRSKQPLL